ncbi:hypothetical protein LCGC14_2941680, partial [marine sediment metagenome]
VNNAEYNWNINQNGELVVSNLNYSSGDVFRAWYHIYNPITLPYSLNDDKSTITYLKITNKTGFEYQFILNQDYKLSDDGYTIYLLDIYNSVLKSGNFSISDNIKLKYHAPLSRKVNLASNLLFLLQDSQGNYIPIDFNYDKPLKVNSSLSIPIGGGKRLVHMTLAYLPTTIYNLTSDQSLSINYEDQNGNNIYPYIESNKWAKPITIITKPEKVKLLISNDYTQDIVITQEFDETRKYNYNYNPMETFEKGEEYTHVSIDALIKNNYQFFCSFHLV